jgi:hypothetical protein
MGAPHPFVRELVVPYWSLDLFFCGAFFLCGSKVELNLLTKRLIAVTMLSGLCYVLFPLKLALPRPEPEGWTAPLFHALYFNDLPYNLAPSLHISLRSSGVGVLRRASHGQAAHGGEGVVHPHRPLHAARLAASSRRCGEADSSWAGPSRPLIPDPRQLGTKKPFLKIRAALRHRCRGMHGAEFCLDLLRVARRGLRDHGVGVCHGPVATAGQRKRHALALRRVVPAAGAHRNGANPAQVAPAAARLA